MIICIRGQNPLRYTIGGSVFNNQDIQGSCLKVSLLLAEIIIQIPLLLTGNKAIDHVDWHLSLYFFNRIPILQKNWIRPWDICVISPIPPLWRSNGAKIHPTEAFFASAMFLCPVVFCPFGCTQQIYSDVQTAVTAHFSSKLLLQFVFTWQ